ncbi:alpha-glucuronidase [Cellulomonas persica]|uniref:Xylan alpha-1,2-glucuronidase n=1 Tax=Cellulomonas persica TaxID=76861 RepID=A0A510UW71_9CELL|nr:alpha-glucuronidase [Cellulomonas persica]GEK17045.1 xylan alpha-1,2-glucuronidase [Cellulomonas persica]
MTDPTTAGTTTGGTTSTTSSTTSAPGWHAAWLPDEALRPLGTRGVRLLATGDDPVLTTVRAEVARAAQVARGTTTSAPVTLALAADALAAAGPGAAPRLRTAAEHAIALAERPGLAGTLGAQGFVVTRDEGALVVVAAQPRGLLAGWHHLVRTGGDTSGEAAGDLAVHVPAQAVRMLDHWDNLAADSPMGPVERGYAGASLWFADGRVRDDLTRVEHYARLLAHTGINAVCLNNVNVHARESALLTTGIDQVARLATIFRAAGISTYLAVDFAAPITSGALDTSDPLDDDVRAWWERAFADVYATIPDFGGVVVKADSEGRPGPFAYGRTHADGANLLGRALAPHGGTVFWRAFVYDHRQDWRDRGTDRARAAYDHFTPLDGQFDDNAVLQVKLGPVDFQVREPLSPLLAAMPHTRLAMELQVTQEYTGQQQHVCYLAPLWREALDFRPWGPVGGADAAETDARTVADVVRGTDALPGGLVAVANVGDDPFWTGHPLAQANLYAYGRLTWDPTLDPSDLLDEWAARTFPQAGPAVARTVHALLDDSWHVYESYTAPLGIGFMVRPGHHYGPDVDGYEYTPWGTYHFADRDGIGVDRTRATGTGFTGQYPAPWRDVYESLETCPDELLLFFHHVPYTHVLHSGSTVVQHVYDTHVEGAAATQRMRDTWRDVRGVVPDEVFDRVAARLDEQVRSAAEWRDQINTYFWRKSGIPDPQNRVIP